MNKYIFLVVALFCLAVSNNLTAQDSKKEYKQTMKNFKVQFKNAEKELVRLQDERVMQIYQANKIKKEGESITPTLIKVIDKLSQKLSKEYASYKDAVERMENYLDRQDSTQAIIDLTFIDLEEKNLQKIKDQDKGKSMLAHFNGLKEMHTK